MPLSELYGLRNGKMESAQQKSTDISLIPDNEFVELVWENGQIMMQGQSSKSKKSPVSSNFQFHTTKIRDKDNGTFSKNGKFPTFDSTFPDMSIPVPSIEMNRNDNDDDMVPWLNNYPVVDEYCSELISSSSKTGNLDPWSIGSDLISSTTGQPHPGQAGGSSRINVQRQDTAAALNFSHFLRPNRANLQAGDKGLGASTSNSSRSLLVEDNLVSPGKAVGETIVIKNKNDKCGTDNEKTVEPIAGSSSVCSGNSAERASNDLSNNLKRKSRDTEDSEWQSEDADEELTIKRTTGRGGTGSKRSRAAEVHNLSERRRRDRINEKMRALQELIPNCNKVDKASMLDEAIEYLKTLQLQVQIMSMGAGLYMPQLMFPTGVQHMPQFPLMGFGMGMGMSMGTGFGMGMVDMSGASCGPPCPAPPGFANFHASQIFGQPGQVLPMTVSGSPMVPLPTQPPINSNTKDPIRTSTQFQVKNDGSGHSIMLQKNKVAQDTAKSSNANEPIPKRVAGSG